MDATYLLTVVQSMRSGPPFAVGGGVDVVTPNDLPRRAADRQHYTIVGGGKTGMDCCLWLLPVAAAQRRPGRAVALDRAA